MHIRGSAGMPSGQSTNVFSAKCYIIMNLRKFSPIWYVSFIVDSTVLCITQSFKCCTVLLTSGLMFHVPGML